MSRAQVVTELVASSPAFPPSFDNSPWLFGIALFARLLVMLLSAATVVRLISRGRQDRLPCDHPAYYHRVMVSCILTAAFLGSTSDVLTWLFWGELNSTDMGLLLTVTKALDASTMIPFLLGLFVPYWTKYLRRCGFMQGAGLIVLNGAVTDMRITWGQVGVPLKLVGWSAAGAAITAAAKWWLWIGGPSALL